MAAEPNIGAVKIVGYLEKRGKMKVVTTWKKYWFVLEGRLLLYYRSQEEYENLSPCKGSINMGLATSIKPGLATAGVLEIITRTNTITLRAKHRSIQEKWLQALMDASGQQSSVSSPVKMTHFRYSMDNLIPPQTKAKQLLTRQNTLPYRFNNNNNTKTELSSPHSKDIVTRLQQIGACTYGGSLDSIVRKTRQRMSEASSAPSDATETPEGEAAAAFEKNDLYDLNDVFIDNTAYISALDHPPKSDCNKNNLLIENTEYVKCDDDNNDLDYYCTYEEVNGNGRAVPELPPRRPDDLRPNVTEATTAAAAVAAALPEGREQRRSESDDGSVIVAVAETKKMSTFSKIARKFKNLKSMKKKKCDEPIYDTVNYLEIHEIKNAANDENIVKTLLDLKQTLEENKLKVKDILQSTSSKIEQTDEQKIVETPQTPTTFEASSGSSPKSINCTDAPEKKIPPGLPPRSGSKNRKRSPSPFHDTPKNNSPVHPNNISIDKILDDLEQERNDEELNVRQLIKKFNKIEPEQCADVSLRQKNDKQRMNDDDDADDATSSPMIVNRYSEDLNKLLEELTKVTSAPLMTPGVTSSLIQMKSPPVTDEEWLALTPIRRRRFSDPDYDVPRSHRSLQILAQTTNENVDDEVIPATRFFGPVLSPSNTESWRSMTPDSLEPAQLLQAAARKQHARMAAEKDEERKLTSVSDCLIFLDSLEPQSEGATAF